MKRAAYVVNIERNFTCKNDSEQGVVKDSLSSMNKKDFNRAMYLTNVLRVPDRKIYTFWDTKFKYYIISGNKNKKAVLRIGDMSCAKPTIVTPDTFEEAFQGFPDEAVEFAREKYGSAMEELRILGYQFRNRLKSKKAFDLTPEQLLDTVVDETEHEAESAAIIDAPNDIWPISLMKVALEIVTNSFPGNLQDFEERGHFLGNGDKRRLEIECLFSEAEGDSRYVNDLGKKLQEYGLFAEYEDRFYQLVRV